MMCEPSLTWSLAMATQVSQSASSIASRNFFEPFALVRSPIINSEVVASPSAGKITGE